MYLWGVVYRGDILNKINNVKSMQLNRQGLQGMELAKRRFALSVMIPILAYMLFWTVLPYLWVIVLSLFEYSPRRIGGAFLGLGGDNPFVGLDHFKAMLDFSDEAPRHVKQFRLAMKNTFLFSGIVVPLNLMITIPLAVLVNEIKNKSASTLFRTVFFTPVITSSVGVGLMWGYIFNPQRGILNHFLSNILGSRVSISWLQDASLTFGGIPVSMFAVMVAYLWMDLGYNFIIFLAGLQSIPDSINEAAVVDGAGPIQRFFRITLPLLAPQILLTSILTMISAFQIYDLIKVMTNGGPDNMTRVVVLEIFDGAFRYQRMGWSSAVSLVFFIVVLIISLIQRKVIRQDWEY